MENGIPRAFYCLSLLALLVSFSSCTSIKFHGKGLIPLYLTPRPDHVHRVTVEGRKEFYLWGLIGPDDDVYMDEQFYDNGLISVASIDIQEFQKPSSYWKAILSLGFYIPKDYVISGLGISPGARR
ncbi:MAG: hypothetical protein NXH75_01455 [Halobacteriovoraceae bacterium]|nr:hypothetical protein [Halobacteriovoraceae bacterium]